MAEYLILQDNEHLQGFSVGEYFDFTVASAKNPASYKYIVQNSRHVLRDISEIVGNSVLTPSQNLFSNF